MNRMRQTEHGQHISGPEALFIIFQHFSAFGTAHLRSIQSERGAGVRYCQHLAGSIDSRVLDHSAITVAAIPCSVLPYSHRDVRREKIR
jgi:hypothetical protein